MGAIKEGSSFINDKRAIEVSGDLIRYTYQDITYYFTLNNELLEILKLNRARPMLHGKKDSYLVFEFNRSERLYAHDLAFACYHTGARASSFCEDIRRFRDNKRMAKLVIDHADDNKHNNTIYNLSLMTETENWIKSSTISRFTFPTAVIPAYCGEGVYRLAVMSTAEPGTKLHEMICRKAGVVSDTPLYSTLYFSCVGSQEFVSCIKNLPYVQIEESTKTGKNKSGAWNNRGGRSLLADTYRSIFCQRSISELDKSYFHRYNSEEKQATA